MQTLFSVSPFLFFPFGLCVLRYMKEEGTVPKKLAVTFDPVMDEESELSLSIALARYQNAAIITQLQMKEKSKPAVCSDGKARRLERSLCHTYQLCDISQEKTPGSDAYLQIPAPVNTCKSHWKRSVCHLPAETFYAVLKQLEFWQINTVLWVWPKISRLIFKLH